MAVFDFLPGTDGYARNQAAEAEKARAKAARDKALADAARGITTRAAAGNSGDPPQSSQSRQDSAGEPTYYPQNTQGRQDNVPPSVAAAPPQTEAFGGSLNTPGTGELFYDEAAGQWRLPSPEELEWKYQQEILHRPSGAEINLDKDAQDTRAGIGHSALDDIYANSGLEKPGTTEDWYARHQHDLDAPGFGESALNDTIGQLGIPGAMEGWWAQHQNDLSGPGTLEQQSGRVQRDIDAARSVEGFNARNLRQLEMPGYTERMAGAYRDTPSYSENFYTGGAASEGLDRLYNRLYDQGSRKLGTEAAARGGWNSGAALRGTEELSRDMNAAHVKDQMAAADQADRQKIARYGEGRQLMTGADSALNNRLSTGGTLTRSQDDVALARAAAEQNLYTGVSGEKRANFTAAGTMAGSAQEAALARLTERANAGDMSAKLALNRFKASGDAAELADVAKNRRITTRADIGEKKERLTLDTRKHADDADIASQGIAAGRGRDAMAGATSAGLGQRGRLSAGQVAANTAQQAKEGRIRGKFEDAINLGDKQAQTYARAIDTARTEEYDGTVAQLKLWLQNKDIDQAEYARRVADAERIRNAPRTATEIYAATNGLPVPSSRSGGSSATPPPREPEGHAVTDLAAGR